MRLAPSAPPKIHRPTKMDVIDALTILMVLTFALVMVGSLLVTPS